MQIFDEKRDLKKNAEISAKSGGRTLASVITKFIRQINSNKLNRLLTSEKNLSNNCDTPDWN